MAVHRPRGRRLQTIRKQHFAEHPLCVRCEAKGLVAEAVQLDHVVPLAKGGTDEPSNRQGLCDPCHKAKTAEDFGHRERPTIGADGFPVASPKAGRGGKK